MKKISLALAIIVTLAAGCFWGAAKPPKSQLEIREIQTRTFDAKTPKLVIKALLNVLQDEGFIVKSADVNLGFISATKERDLGGGPPIIWGPNTTNEPPRWRKTEVIETTGNVSEYGKAVRVRMVFQRKILDNMGGVMEVNQIDDQAYYQDFFSKVDKGLFLQKEKL